MKILSLNPSPSLLPHIESTQNISRRAKISLIIVQVHHATNQLLKISEQFPF